MQTILKILLATFAPLAALHAQQPSSNSTATVRDRLWVFAVAADLNNSHLELGNVRGGSRMTPAEGAFRLGVPNILFIRAFDIPPLLGALESWRAKTAFEQYAISFQPLDRVVWSVVGSSGKGGLNELPHAISLARKPMEIWVTLYSHEINESRKTAAPTYRGCEPPLASFLDQFDVLTLWTWNSDELRELEGNLVALEKIAPKKFRIALGLYIWDFHNKKPVSVGLMQHQCDLGLKWLKEGRISDMIFLANTVLDVGLPSA